MTKDEIRQVIDRDNGAGFARNVNLDGYVFRRNKSFIVFELKNLDGVKVCHVKYFHQEGDERDVVSVLVHSCNFWMGNKVQFIFYREKDREDGLVGRLLDLGFREDTIRDYRWKWKFDCNCCGQQPCECVVHALYK